MSETKVRRVDPEQLTEDRKSAKGLLEIPDYDPHRTEFSAAAVKSALDAVQPLLDAEESAKRAYETARDNAVAAEWALHTVVVGMKQQVVSQYGDDSNQAQAVGLKKKSEYKSSSRKPKA